MNSSTTNGGTGSGSDAVTTRARALLSGVAQFLFPSACAICRVLHTPDRHGIVCPSCLARLVPLPNPTCARCGHPRLSVYAPLPGNTSARGRATAGAEARATDVSKPAAAVALPSCRWCARLPSYVRVVRSVCRMDSGTGAEMVHALKYGGWPDVARPMAERLARVDLPPDVVEERTALVPLPLSRTRERERGYNQAERLATALAPHWNIPVWRTVLQRTRDTQSQVRLTPSERTSNVSRAFATSVNSLGALRGTHVVLVDDVITTAATLNAAAQALTEGGARIISYVTFGRAPDPGDRSDFDFDPDRD